MMKRSRLEDGTHSRVGSEADHETLEDYNGFGEQLKATDDVMRGRRVVKATATRVTELKRHSYALNQSFYQGIKIQSSQNGKGSWIENMKEYLAYAQEIHRRYGNQRGVAMSFGSGDCGQLGHGVEEDRDMCVKFPREIKELSMYQIIRVACGGLHTMALTNNGAVYTWGCNDDGALGRQGDENMPGQVTGFPENTTIINIVGGDCHTTALSADGAVFTWGSYKDKEGKLWCDGPTPKDTFKNKQLTPYKLPTLANVVDIKSGSCFNLARCADGQVYSWGLGEMGNLGRPVSSEIRDAAGEYNVPLVFNDHLTPQVIKLNGKSFGCKAFGAGSYHSLFVHNESSGIYTCGLNNYGQLGLGHDTNQTELQLVEELSHKNGLYVEGGTHHSVVLMSDGTIYTFGRGDSGQLGVLDNPSTGVFKTSPQEIKVPGVTFCMISCGSNHALAVTDDNAIYSWGYGDMLALGNGAEKDELKPRKIEWAKTKFGPARIIQVAAGGQHSVVVVENVSGIDPFNEMVDDCADPVCHSKTDMFRSSVFGKKKKISKKEESSESLECPLDRDELGHSTWGLLHTMAAYYPDKPSDETKKQANEFVHSFANLYPCKHCAVDFQESIKETPPRVNSRIDFSLWMCEQHNRVTTKLNKKEFKCTIEALDKRWKNGTPGCWGKKDSDETAGESLGQDED